MKQEISFDELLEIQSKLDIRIGQIVNAERVPKSDKLIKLTVVFGITKDDEKTVVTNLGTDFHPDDFLGLEIPFIMNLKPSKMMGITSEAMIVVGDINGVIQLNDYSVGAKLL
jgi:methionyl-tRNA synthetase